jgi:hypothetical protein
MEEIIVTFPKSIPTSKIEFIMEENLKRNSKFRCICKYLKEEDNENVYSISSGDGAEAFYFIGMTASCIIEKS